MIKIIIKIKLKFITKKYFEICKLYFTFIMNSYCNYITILFILSIFLEQLYQSLI